MKFIQDDDKITLCIIEGTKDNFSNFIKKKYGIDVSDDCFPFPKQIIGVAKRHPDDPYDSDIGKEIAKMRAIEKRNKKMVSLHKKFLKSFYKDFNLKEMYKNLNVLFPNGI